MQWLSQGNVGLPDLDYSCVERWLRRVAEDHNCVLGPMTYIFCDDPTILDVNVKFLGHNYFTDIITFDDTLGRRVSGDIYISLDTVRSNAQEVVNQPYAVELHRVIAHGLLHLCGINDKGPGEREIMEQHENRALEMLPDNYFNTLAL